MTNLTTLAARHAGRPLLLTPRAAMEIAARVRDVDPEAVVKPGRFSALLRKLAGRDRRPDAMDDAEDYASVPLETRLAYAPLYAGEPDDVGFCWTLKDGVALMQIDKPLLDRGEVFCGEVYHGYDTLLQALREANGDDRVRAVFIREATPGGVVASGLPALADYMRENGARAGGKPIHVYADMACSAGYWIASGADRIVSGRVGLVGSIGAVIVHENWSGALEKAGVEITPIQFGQAKTDGAWFAALSDRARADLQAEIDQCGRDFVADVVAGRPQLSPEEVLATQAAVFMGHHDDAARSALALKLVDAIASEEAAFSELRDQVAGSQKHTVPGSIASAGSARDRASASPAKEAPVAKTPMAGGKPSANAAQAAALAAAKAAVRKAQAEVARLSAEAADQTPDDDEVENDAPAAETDPDDDDTEEGGAPAAQTEDDDSDGADQTEAEKIAGSPEAEANPRAATAAIKAGLTYAQFRQTSAAFAASGGRRLEATLKGSPRLGADAVGASATPAAGLDPAAIYKRRAERARAIGG